MIRPAVCLLTMAFVASAVVVTAQPRPTAGELDGLLKLLRTKGSTSDLARQLHQVFMGTVTVDRAQANSWLSQRIYSGVVIGPMRRVEPQAVTIRVQPGKPDCAWSDAAVPMLLDFIVPVEWGPSIGGNPDPEAQRLLRLQPGARIKVRGTLHEIEIVSSGTSNTCWVSFRDAAVEEFLP